MTAAAAGVGAIVAAVIAAVKGLGKAVGSTVDNLGGLTATLASADTDFTKPVQSVGGKLREQGETLTSIGNGFGIVLIGAGAAVQNFGRIISEINATAERYAEVNPQIAFAEAMSDVTQVMNDFRRGQQIAPAMTQFIQARTEVQQRYEDIKVRALQLIVPAATEGLKVLSKVLEGVEGGIETLKDVLTGLKDLPLIGDIAKKILDALKDEEEEIFLDIQPQLNNQKRPEFRDVFRGRGV